MTNMSAQGLHNIVYHSLMWKGGTKVAEPALRVLSLGAGVQSTTLILMAAHGEFDSKPDVAIFADTGWEPKRVYDHLDWLESEVGHIIPIVRVSNGNIRQDVLNHVATGSRVANPPFYVKNPDGTGGVLRRGCTTEYKIVPINNKIRQLLGVKPGGRVPKGTIVEQWFGISLDEAHRMKDSRDKWVVNRYPLIEKGMDRNSCLMWMDRHGYRRPPKSACIGCPYHSTRYWREMRDKYPEEWTQAVEWDVAIRHGMKGVIGECYLNRSLVPLDEVDLRTTREKGQLTFFEDGFGNECEGFCGL